MLRFWEDNQCKRIHQSGMFVYKGVWSGPVSVGCVAGDAQSYILFCDFFDRVIEAHHEHKISSQTPESDFNYDNLKVAGPTINNRPRRLLLQCHANTVRRSCETKATNTVSIFHQVFSNFSKLFKHADNSEIKSSILQGWAWKKKSKSRQKNYSIYGLRWSSARVWKGPRRPCETRVNTSMYPGVPCRAVCDWTCLHLHDSFFFVCLDPQTWILLLFMSQGSLNRNGLMLSGQHPALNQRLNFVATLQKHAATVEV